jgi:allophanate hydrolase subunit 1
MTGADRDLELRRYGDRAWLVTGADPVALAALAAGVRWGMPCEATVGARTCLLAFDGPAPDASAVRAALSGAGAGLAVVQPREHRIPVRYHGPDLAEVAAASGLSELEAAACHTGSAYRVAFLGFAPGFAYLEGLPEVLRLPRRAVPRVRVPAGSVAIADVYSAVYPAPSPGGWHLLGTTAVRLFDAGLHPPSLLAPGDVVRFEALEESA